MRSGRARQGFTMLELLATLGVVSVLMVLLTAGAQSMMRRAATSKLVSNLHSCAAGLMQFATDNGGRFPASGGGNYATGTYTSWQMAVAPYVQEPTIYSGRLDNTPAVVKRSVFRDPLDKTLGTYGGNTRHIRNIAINGTSSFGPDGTEAAAWGASYRLLSSIAYPSQLLLLTTGQNSEVGEEFAGAGMRVGSTYYSKKDPKILTRIPDQYYCVFADGHFDVLDEATMVREATNDDTKSTSRLFDKPANNGAGKTN